MTSEFLWLYWLVCPVIKTSYSFLYFLTSNRISLLKHISLLKELFVVVCLIEFCAILLFCILWLIDWHFMCTRSPLFQIDTRDIHCLFESGNSLASTANKLVGELICILCVIVLLLVRCERPFPAYLLGLPSSGYNSADICIRDAKRVRLVAIVGLYGTSFLGPLLTLAHLTYDCVYVLIWTFVVHVALVRSRVQAGRSLTYIRRRVEKVVLCTCVLNRDMSRNLRYLIAKALLVNSHSGFRLPTSTSTQLFEFLSRCIGLITCVTNSCQLWLLQQFVTAILYHIRATVFNLPCHTRSLNLLCSSAYHCISQGFLF